MTNNLYFGDNLDVLRNKIKDESVDLVYLDPPFKSNANYNVLFKDRAGEPSESQAEAFRDTWEWGKAARDAYGDIERANGDVALLLASFRRWMGENAMTAYLGMMTVRLLELRRVMRPAASIYLHCDPTASHYLKLVLDAIFGHESFVAEVIWRRTNARGTTGRWPRLHDTIFHYATGNAYFKSLKAKADKAKLPHTLITGDDGIKYQTFELTGAGKTKQGESGKPWRGHDPGKLGRHWGNSHAQMDEWDNAGLIHWPRDNGFPRRRAETPFDPESRMVTVGDVWTDIDRLNQTAKERLGYPTQKPVALLKRIIEASSTPDMVVLDPFCGCGTTVEAAEQLGRTWTGIDVTHYAITLIERRLAKLSPRYQVAGRPTDLAGARELFVRDPYQFQWWAAWRLGAQTYRETKRGADRGIDGNIFFANGPYGTGRIIISVKGGDHLAPAFVRELRGTIEREEASMGILITLAEPTKAMNAEAAAAGFVSKSAHGRLPRLQNATIADILEGRMPKLPPLPAPQRIAPRMRPKDGQLELLLPFEGEKMPDLGGDFVDPRFLELA